MPDPTDERLVGSFSFLKKSFFFSERKEKERSQRKKPPTPPHSRASPRKIPRALIVGRISSR
jgi:hypothetical protein